jgi:hypothetical protein
MNNKIIKNKIKIKSSSLERLARISAQPTMVAHSCNLSCSGGRDWEDHSLKPTWAKS